MTWLAYLADVAILAAYAGMVLSGRSRAFHWANALGCFPLIAVEVQTHAWPPLVLTTAFGALGWVGLIRNDETNGGTR